MKIKKIVVLAITVCLLTCLSGIGAAQDDANVSETDVSDANVSETDVSDVNDVQPYRGWLAPDHPLYGLKLAVEGIDEAISINAERRL